MFSSRCSYCGHDHQNPSRSPLVRCDAAWQAIAAHHRAATTIDRDQLPLFDGGDVGTVRGQRRDALRDG